MNERLKQLAIESKLIAPEYNGFDHTRLSISQQKFAELIVGECYETIKKDMELANIQLILIDFGIYANGRLRRIIKEHFGVEE
jgi:hypothetical protein